MVASAIQLQTVDRTVNSLVHFAAGYPLASLSKSLSRTEVAVVDFRSLITALYVAKDVLNYSDCFGCDTMDTCM
jgi:hypothetical protein